MIGLEYLGVHESISNAIGRADLDMRKELYSNIVLAGGSTLTKGFGDRLLKELITLAPQDTKIKISAPPEVFFCLFSPQYYFILIPIFF